MSDKQLRGDKGRSAAELVAWIQERIDNAHRLAAMKTREDRAGWLEDASYYADIIAAISTASTAEPSRPDMAEAHKLAMDAIVYESGSLTTDERKKLARAFLALEREASSAGTSRSAMIHANDCPTAWAFFNKHSLGSKLPPSCLVCGHAPGDVEDIAIRHMDLPNIIVCKKCRDASTMAPTDTSR